VASTYISAHTIVNNIAIYTAPGTNPAYVAVDVGLMGTGGVTAAALTEATVRTRFEGFTTDSTRKIHLYGLDYVNGTPTDRDWGTIGVDPGPLVGAVRGRWRFRPPCTGTVATDKQCTPPANGVFLPAPREVRAVIEGAWAPGQTATAANGLIYGQYHAPIGEYIFPEQIPGAPVPPANFESMPCRTAAMCRRPALSPVRLPRGRAVLPAAAVAAARSRCRSSRQRPVRRTCHRAGSSP
jgi:hypothetical protein